jgi:hypothetical protein
MIITVVKQNMLAICTYRDGTDHTYVVSLNAALSVLLSVLANILGLGAMQQ